MTDNINKYTALERLYEGTDYENGRELTFVTGEYGGTGMQSLLLEGVDFDLTFTPLKHLGRKAVLSAIGGLYAQLCKPRGLSVVLGLSSKLSFDNVRELWSGMVSTAKEHGIKELHLDMKPSLTGLAISLDAVGDRVMDFAPFADMDLVCLSGNVGGAFFGQQVLLREKEVYSKAGNAAKQPDLTPYKNVVGNFLSPVMYTDVVDRFREFGVTPTGGVFLSVPLANGVKELQGRSGFGVKIYTDRIPLDPGTGEAAEEFHMDAMTAALNGGDDYRFLFTVPIGQVDTLKKDFQDYDIIGHLARPEVGAVVVVSDGVELKLRAQGYADEPDPGDDAPEMEV
ncbi:MAG: thiamine-phosphate kinase [Bacteroidales bacterium]|jgi:thiamine-monophosphate kinase|nr:thiamine-phosphate kinase [Bacteroidales bacterium]